MRDPRIRKDGLCAQCRGPRLTRLPKVITQRSREELFKNLNNDPFCSSRCCRTYYGIDVAESLAKTHDEDPEGAFA